MEINHSSAGKSDQVAWSSDDLQQGSGSHVGVGSGKSYTCSFCKRGFSNAQALGGHMNIHRRDRAKLKQASEENHQLLSLEISMTTPIDDPQAFEDKTSSSPLESLERRSRSATPKRPGSLSIEIEDGETSANKNSSQLGQQQLPFFEDSKRSITNPSGDDDGKKQTSRHGDSSQEAELLDLELRLGPEPHETSRRSRKGFF